MSATLHDVFFGDANRQIPPTLPGWHVGGEANPIEREAGSVPVLNDTAGNQMRSTEPRSHRPVTCL